MAESYPRRDQARGIWKINQITKNIKELGTYPKGSTTGIAAGGLTPGYQKGMDTFTVETTGNSTDFGDLTVTRSGLGSCSNGERGVWAGGGSSNVIDYVTISTTGNATDFGDLTAAGTYLDAAGASNSKKAIAFGYQVNTIDSINIATTGNATDFGDTLTSTYYQIMGADNGGGGLPQEGSFPQRPSVNYMPGSGRGFVAGGQTPSLTDRIQINHIPTAGNAVDFGNLTSTNTGTSSVSSVTRGIINGGIDPSITNRIEAFEMASFGNAADFGDLTGGNERAAGVSGSPGGGGGSSNNFDRALFSGGTTGTGGTTTIEYLAIATGGATTDFGDMAVLRGGHASFGNSGRTVFSNGETGSNTYSSNMEYVTPSTPGNAVSFGTNDTGKAFCGAVADLTRGVIGGGAYYTSSWNFRERMDYVAIDTTGNSTTFGNLGWGWACAGSASSGDNTYGCWSGGVRTSDTQYIGYFERITIQTTGNASSFGSFSNGDARAYSAGFSDANYSFTAGGINTSGYIDHIDRHSITTGGTGTNIADLSADKYSLSAANNGTTAVIGGGYQSQMYNEVEEFNMGTNAISSTFGTLSAGGRYRLDATSGGAA